MDVYQVVEWPGEHFDRRRVVGFRRTCLSIPNALRAAGKVGKTDHDEVYGNGCDVIIFCQSMEQEDVPCGKLL